MPKRKKNGESKGSGSKKRTASSELWVPPLADLPAPPVPSATDSSAAISTPATTPAVSAGAAESAAADASATPPADRPVKGRPIPAFALGATLYPLDSESQSSEDSYLRDQADDLSAMSAAGFSLARVFVSWRSIEPQVGQYDAAALARLTDLVAATRKRHLKTIVCLFADDRQAELVDLPWARRRDPRTDPYLLQRETELIAQVVARVAE